MATTVDGQVSVRQIARTFASGKKAENLVYSSLADGGFPSGKVSKGGFYSEGTESFDIHYRQKLGIICIMYSVSQRKLGFFLLLFR